MNISYAWLSDYVDLDGVSPEALADLLTMAGLEVDGLEVTGSSFEGVVVGRVLETRPHPDADRLTLCTVDLGEGKTVPIVCGAPNVASGQAVPVATVGTTLMLPSRKDPSVREPVTLSPAKIRGEVSEGMICAEDELGLSGDHAGIMVLDADAEPGQPFAAYLAARGRSTLDATLDVAITPNRPDATSHIGVARDVAALTRRELKVPEVTVPEAGGEAARQVAVSIADSEACRRYVGMVVRGVRVGPSPEWLQARLRSVGLRPINNVVDVTNFVMHEVGQPLHAFDLDRLAGDGEHTAHIVVRTTEAEEPFTTLDGQRRTLPTGTLLIADPTRPLAVAGVMGGVDSEVTDVTTNLLLESAYFDPGTVRRTARALGLSTDSSYRFERGVDPEGQAWAAARAAALIVEVAGGEVVPGMVDAHPAPVERREIELRLRRIREALGAEIERAEVVRLLRAIGFGVETEGGVADALLKKAGRLGIAEPPKETTTLHLTVPPFRPDIAREIDVIEEVARLYGYDRLPMPERMILPAIAPRPDRRRALRETARARLAGLGFHELYTNSLLPAATAEAFAHPALTDAPVEAVVTANPINREMAALRPSLLPGVLAVAAYNQNRDAGPLRLFEFGHVFGRGDDPAAPVPGYRERESLLLAVSGSATTGDWDEKPREADFFDLKGLTLHLLDALGLDRPEETWEPDPDALTAYRLVLSAAGERFGVLGRVAEAVAEAQGLRAPLFFAELDWSQLSALLASQPEPRYTPVSRFPAVDRDLAVVVDAAEPVGPMLATIRQAGGALLQEARVFDLYTGERLGAGRKSVAFALRFGADRTLTDSVIDKQVRRVVQALEHKHRAELRS
jgi:phenylalanyl-tRNA synthetase beta chain